MTTKLPTRRIDADKHLLAFLIRSKKLDSARAQQIEEWAAAEDLSIIQALAARGILSEEEVASAIAAGLRFPLVKLDGAPFDEQTAVYVKDETAARCVIVPICREGEALVLAMANPFDREVIRAVEFTSGCRVRPAVATRSAVLAAVEQRYKLDKSLRAMLRDIPDAADLELVRPDNKEVDLRALAHEAEGAPVVKMVNLILVDALDCGASDIHVEPGPNFVQIRYRINGVLEDVLEVPKWAQNPTIARLKVMAKLDITERRVPQDGHLRVRHASHVVDFRVSSLPTADGETIVMRVLNSATGLRDLDKIGLSARDLGVLREAIRAPEGMILVTGPTGSGKTTTLYSMIRQMLSPEINIVTIENPIEYQIEGVSQVDINNKQGLTFASVLRSILRQDPDVILVGEIRDRETAEIAFQAAQTGHLVLSTVHTNDTVSTLTRLTELGVEHHVLASSLVAVIAQRLARTVCPSCAAEASPAGSEGCATCRGTGFASRTGLYEVLRVTAAMKKQIEAKASETALRALARAEGMTLMREDALSKIANGATTTAEVSRVVQLECRELRCPQCSNAIEDNFSTCPFCLHQLQMQCASCSKPLKKEWKSCPYCGPAQTAVPATETPAPPREIPRSVAPSLGTIDVPHVLVVDDNEELRTLLRLTLRRSIPSARCDEASNGFEALGKVEAEKPHLIILDVMMPGMDGIEVCKRLRAKLSTALIPVIMLTGCADPASKELGFLAGTDDYLTKPFERAELVARVQRLLQRTYGWSPALPHAA